ncbi:MAG: hypothetical protein H6815_12405 [Phycisphaeraceae bacterium]|nr:hypothetical protein [Phycisphaerales bacterium]MCB9861242.1 hypothetical protein [Phycisphaeraceae bacterium]
MTQLSPSGTHRVPGRCQMDHPSGTTLVRGRVQSRWEHATSACRWKTTAS